MKHRTASVLAGGLAWALSTAAPASAHHSTALYDMTKDMTVKGTVTRVEWTNPHAWIYVNATDEQGHSTVWEFETLSPNILARAGWPKTLLTVGEAVTVVAHPQRDGAKRARLDRVILLNGRVLLPGREPAVP